MLSPSAPDPSSPFATGRRPGYITLIVNNDARVDREPADEASPAPTIASSVAPSNDLPIVDAETAERHRAIIASDNRPLPIRIISRIISSIRTAGVAYRMLRSIPNEIDAAVKVASEP